MQDLLVEYLENLGTCLSLKEYDQLISKIKTILSKDMFEKLKKCFNYEEGWLFVGLDFDSLEDKISAVTTKDPNKIKVYRDGYDGHCLRAYKYFGEHMPDIDSNSVDSINSIKKKYKYYRQESKAPTFALTYQGTYITLMNNCGFTEELAKSIEANYHELYSVSDEYINNRLKTASNVGYVDIAFGLRLRTPLLKQVILGTSQTPYEAAAEGRTAGNAMGQSWCLLNTRAASEFLNKTRKSIYRLDIKPCAQIHDAQYFLAKDNLEVLEYVNTHLVKAVSWQEDSEIQNEYIKMSGELSIFYPNWCHELVIPNNATQQEIKKLAINFNKKLKESL